MSTIVTSRGARPGRPFVAARVLLTLVALSLLAIWLFSLPEYFGRVTSLSVETYTQAGRLIVGNDPVQTEAAASGLSLSRYALYQIGLSAFMMIPFWLVAALILWRADNKWFTWFTALILGGLGALSFLPILTVTRPPGPVLGLVELLSWIVWPGMFAWFFLFPGGGAVPRWAALPVGVMQVLFLALSVRGFLAEWGLLSPDPANLQFVLGLPMGVISLVLVVYAQAYRYRRVYSAAERQQVKWFVFAMALLVIELAFAAVFPPANVSPLAQDLYGAVLLVIPASVGIAILRYRLWDIDVIIRKTLVYGALTALLALVYFGGVVIFQRLVGALTGAEQSPLAVAISTLAIVVLFTPLRRRIQEFIDRRFFRKKYDAQQVLARFALTARDETNLGSLTAELVRVVQETLQPERVSVLLTNFGREGEASHQ